MLVFFTHFVSSVQNSRLLSGNVQGSHKVETHKCTWYRDYSGQRSLIDFCMISADLFRSVLDVHVKRGAKLSTDHNLLICSLHLEKPPEPTQTCRTRRFYRIEWEFLVDKDIGKIFCRQRPCSKNFKECTADAEWRLPAVASSATRVWGRKRLSASNNGKKRST